MTLVAPRIVTSVSCVTRLNHEIHFSWQAQYLVSVDTCRCSAHCKYSVSCVKRIKDEYYFSWQAQYLVKFKCHFSWQAQYSVKFGMIAGARNVAFFNTKCSRWA